MEYFGTNLKNPKEILGQTLKSQVKKEISFPCITIKKKKDIYFVSYDTPILYYIKKEQAINFVSEIF